jgi:hypothetical protein
LILTFLISTVLMVLMCYFIFLIVIHVSVITTQNLVFSSVFCTERNIRQEVEYNLMVPSACLKIRSTKQIR